MINKNIFTWNGPFGLPEFGKIKSADYAAAFDVALSSHRVEINGIAENSDAPSFENTIQALELCGDKLHRVSALFWNLIGSNSDDVMRKLEREIAPKLSKHSSETAANKDLFARVDALWQGRKELGLSKEQERVLERSWQGFVRGGAGLEDKQQAQLAEINAELAVLGASFSQNILKDEKDWILILENKDDLAGLPDFLISAMKSVADERGHGGKHAVTLSRSIIEPFLIFSEHRQLREKAFKAWTARGGNGGESDNLNNVKQTVALRQEKARLLGFDSFADFKLDIQMAKKPAAVIELLEAVWEKAIDKAAQEE